MPAVRPAAREAPGPLRRVHRLLGLSGVLLHPARGDRRALPAGQGEVVERRTRKGRIFYGCANYPACTFTSWDRPVGRTCPECGHILVDQAGAPRARRRPSSAATRRARTRRRRRPGSRNRWGVRPDRPRERGPAIRSTTVVAVRRDGAVALAGDGQVSVGNTVLKHGARKIRRVGEHVLLRIRGVRRGRSDPIRAPRGQALRDARRSGPRGRGPRQGLADRPRRCDVSRRCSSSPTGSISSCCPAAATSSNPTTGSPRSGPAAPTPSPRRARCSRHSTLGRGGGRAGVAAAGERDLRLHQRPGDDGGSALAPMDAPPAGRRAVTIESLTPRGSWRSSTSTSSARPPRSAPSRSRCATATGAAGSAPTCATRSSRRTS